MRQGRSVQKLHDEESAVFFLADVVNSADVGVVERGCGFGLAAKALQCLAVLRQVFGEKLESDEAAETRIFRFVDHPHAAATELFDDPVMRDGLIEHGRV